MSSDLLLNSLRIAAAACFFYFFAWIVRKSLRTIPLARPTRGYRGLKRAKALEGGSFTTLEPLMRYLGAWVEPIVAPATRATIDQAVIRAGNFLGLDGSEYLALCFLAALGFGGLGMVTASMLDKSLFGGAMIGSALGGFVVRSQLNSETAKRYKAIDRGLPGAIDLAALCMSAGLDLVGALKNIVHFNTNKDSVIQEELERILQELELGTTRKQALVNFQERAPTSTVKDFVSAVVQSEEKGSPLAEVLRIQATMLRMHRSVRAEEAAARAGVMMMAPLMMIFASIMIILLAPMVIENMSKGF